jgi:hypothetical protein
MVKPPKYQAQDVGRLKEIPRAFERYCPDSYSLEKVGPRKGPPIPGPTPRPTFRVLDENGELVAYFHPYGNSECYSNDFKEIYEKMLKDIEKAGIEAMEQYE